MCVVSQFLKESDGKAFDSEHRRKIQFNIGKYDHSVDIGKALIKDLPYLRKKTNYIKWKSIENLEAYLLEFERNFTARGGKVIWARNADEANTEILKIFQKHQASQAVKSKSMVTEEIHLNKAMKDHGIDVLETDLGEFIVQLRNEAPYHIVTPAMHLSKEDIALTFHEKFGLPINSTPQEIAAFARKILRDKYLESAIGITGVNFLLAKEGGMAMTENEGNGRLSFGYPKVHIAIAGIEKIIPSMNDLNLFWPMLGIHGTGQFVTVYNSLVFGPKQSKESDGPEEMYVILLDNGRTEILAKPEARQSLYCIRCGACLNACPVYKNIGGHTYGTTYAGPIGAVISPHLNGMKEAGHLSYASSLCGNCTEVCPVNIELHKILLTNRKEYVENQFSTSTERLTWKIWKKAMLNRSWMNQGSASVKNFVFRHLAKSVWGNRRSPIHFAEMSFHELWKAERGFQDENS
jgi:L-lactate dehydrogenase complex protein LldF